MFGLQEDIQNLFGAIEYTWPHVYMKLITYDLFLFKGLKLIGSQWAFCGKMTSYRRVKPEFVHSHGAFIFETGIQI